MRADLEQACYFKSFFISRQPNIWFDRWKVPPVQHDCTTNSRHALFQSHTFWFMITLSYGDDFNVPWMHEMSARAAETTILLRNKWLWRHIESCSSWSSLSYKRRLTIVKIGCFEFELPYRFCGIVYRCICHEEVCLFLSWFEATTVASSFMLGLPSLQWNSVYLSRMCNLMTCLSVFATHRGELKIRVRVWVRVRVRVMVRVRVRVMVRVGVRVYSVVIWSV